MTESLDVPARLADGRSAVDIIGEYVWACHLVGYQNPDLTLHAAQVRDWYGSEDGLDLRALEADRAAVDAAASATDSARRLQEAQTDALAGAWQGRGADASRAFLARHAEASVAAASAVRDAADALAALRDDLWQAVDAKVGAAMEIEGRRHTERAEWLAAARTVTTGAGDRAVASELVDQKVTPFVDNDIRTEWLAAMQKTMTAASAAFDDATSELTGDPATPFEVPGDLGPVSVPSPSGGAQVAEVAGTAPAAWTSPPPAAVVPGPAPTAAPPTAIPVAPEPLAAPVPAAAAPAPAVPPTSAPPTMPSMPSAGELGGGLPGATGGLAGLGTQLADAIGGLVNRPDGGLPDPAQLENEAIDEGPPGVDDEAVDEPGADEAADDEEADDEEADDEEADEADDLAGADEAADESDDACAEEPVDETPVAEPVATPPPEPMPPPPIVEPPPSAEAIGAETPCEIAADELPQAGP
jgi:hypothetical protein